MIKEEIARDLINYEIKRRKLIEAEREIEQKHKIRIVGDTNDGIHLSDKSLKEIAKTLGKDIELEVSSADKNVTFLKTDISFVELFSVT